MQRGEFRISTADDDNQIVHLTVVVSLVRNSQKNVDTYSNNSGLHRCHTLRNDFERKVHTSSFINVKVTYQGEEVCVAILETCTVCLVILMRHGSPGHFIFISQH